jgi:hypothetical protein
MSIKRKECIKPKLIKSKMKRSQMSRFKKLAICITKADPDWIKVQL